jgi:predicted transcriptional regulator
MTKIELLKSMLPKAWLKDPEIMAVVDSLKDKEPIRKNGSRPACASVVEQICSSTEPIDELCRKHGVSRSTIYKILKEDTDPARVAMKRKRKPRTK